MIKRFSEILFNPLLRSSWRSVVVLWKPLAGWTILVYALFTAALFPVLSSLLDRGIFRGDRLIVGNEELLSWFLSPAGFSYVFILILLTLTGTIIRYAGIFQIVTDDLLQRTVSVRDTFLHIAPRVHILLKLCAFTMGAAILLLMPLLLGAGLIYLIFLTEFDINYYIYATPPEWYRALTLGAIWAALWAIFALFITAWSLPALPAYLDGRKSIRAALTEAWKAPVRKTLKLIKSAGMAAGIWFGLRIFTEALLITIFLYLTGWAYGSFDSLRILALLTGTYFFLSVALGTVISFFGFSMISVIVTKYYYSQARPALEMEIPGLKRLTAKTAGFITWWARPLRALSLIAIIAAGGIGTAFLVIETDPPQHEILNIAHRANAGGAPENSLAALEESIRAGAHMAEIDVQLTADGTVIVIHDADFMRVAGDSRAVADVTYDDISDLRLLTDRDFPDESLIIPTLEEYIDAARDRIGLMIELKYYGYDPALAEETIRIIRDQGVEDQVLLMSLSMRGVQQVNDLAPDLNNGYVSAVAAGDLVRLPVDFLAINQQNVSPQIITGFTRRQLPVYAWTVNRSSDMIRAIESGVSGLITDEPQLATEIIGEMNELTRAERLLLRFGFLITVGQTEIEETTQ